MKLSELIRILEFIQNSHPNDLDKNELNDVASLLFSCIDHRITLESTCASKSKDKLLSYFETMFIKHINLFNVTIILYNYPELRLLYGDIILSSVLKTNGRIQFFELQIYRKSSGVHMDKMFLCENTWLPHNQLVDEMNKVSIQLNTFEKDFIDSLRFKYCSYDTLILDLRQNSGGNVKVANMLIKKLVPPCDAAYYFRSKTETKTVCIRENNAPFFKKVYVFVGKMTASSAELLAIVLKEHLHAQIIGEKTFGKGVANSRFIVNENLSISTPTYHYFTQHYDIDMNGLEPDIELSDADIKIWLNSWAEEQ